MLFRRKEKGIDPKERAIWGDLMGLGMVFPIAITAGFFIGSWAGRKLGHPTAGMLLGLLWGVATGFWELYKVTLRMNKRDEDKGREGKGPDGPAS
jgi:hypothetical protein